MDYIVIEDVPPYDGRWEIDIFGDAPLTTREWGWMKRYAGYLPLTLVGDAWGDAETVAVLAIIALRRNGTIETRQVAEAWERFADVPFGATVRLEIGAAEGVEDDADGPPATSSTSSGESLSASSRNGSDSSDSPPSPTGTPASDTSVSAPATSGS